VLVWLLAAVWVDEHYGFKEKLSLTFCSPILYFMLPIIIVGMLIKVSIRMLLFVNPNPTAHNTKMSKSQATRLVSAT